MDLQFAVGEVAVSGRGYLAVLCPGTSPQSSTMKVIANIQSTYRFLAAHH